MKAARLRLSPAILLAGVLCGCRTFGPGPDEKLRSLFSVEGASRDVRGLTDEDPRVRQWSIVKLIARGRTDLAPEIAPLVDPRQEEDARVRATATVAVRAFNHRPAAAAVAANLADPDLIVRLESLKSLRVIGGPEQTPALVKVLANTENPPELRLEAARALGGIRDARGARPLVDCLADPDRSVRFAAHTALVTMAGTDFGGSPDNWRHWLTVQSAMVGGEDN